VNSLDTRNVVETRNGIILGIVPRHSGIYNRRVLCNSDSSARYRGFKALNEIREKISLLLRDTKLVSEARVSTGRDR
jgi:hypothetical protein